MFVVYKGVDSIKKLLVFKAFFLPVAALALLFWAISAGNGLHDITVIATEAKNYLTPRGQLWFEHGYNQAPAVRTILTQLHYSNLQTFTDLAGQPRVTKGIFIPI